MYPLHVLKLSRDINFNKTGNLSFSMCDRLKFKIYGTAENEMNLIDLPEVVSCT